MPPAFTILQLDPTVSVIALEGDLSQQSLQDCQSQILQLTVERQVNVVLDLANVSALDDFALKFFLRIARGLHAHKARLLIVAPQSNVENTLRKANFHTLIPMLPSLTEGLDYALSA